MGTRANDIASLIRTGTQLDSDAIGTNAITAEKLNVGQLGGRRNLIINGAMQVAQRGTQETGITSAGYYTVDRFQFSTNHATFTMDQNTVTDLPGFTKSCKVTCTTAGSPTGLENTNINTRLEGQNLQHLKKGTSNAESVTVSFWVKSGLTGTYTWDIADKDNNRQISATYTIDTADTWEYKTITVAGDTTGTIDNDNGGSFYFNWFLSAGSSFKAGPFQDTWGAGDNTKRIDSNQADLASGNDSAVNYFEITGVQLELGDTATPFEHRSYAEELALCYRYYFKPTGSINTEGSTGYKYGTAGQSLMFNSTFTFPVEMRAAPVATISTQPTFNNCSNLTVNATVHSYISRVTKDGTNGVYRAYGWVADFDAEL